MLILDKRGAVIKPLSFITAPCSCRLQALSLNPVFKLCLPAAQSDCSFKVRGYLKAVKVFCLVSGQVETVGVHHFVPGGGEVLEELVLRVAAGVDFRDGPELGV